jgi:tetratricopeptide (TPR) repeat protein
MNVRALWLLGGALALAGCSSTANGTTPTATVAPTPPSTVATTSPTSDPPVKISSRNPYSRGRSLVKAGQYKAAEAEFNLAVSHRDHLAAAYAGIGIAAIHLADFTRAYHAYQKAVALQPRNPTFLYGAAYAALYARSFHSAISYASNFISVRPKSASGYHMRFLANGQLLRHHQQVLDARKEVQLQPHSAVAYNDLGIALLNDHQYAASIATFSRAIRLDKSYYSYYSNRAIAEAYAKHTSDAIRDLKTAKTLVKDPSIRAKLNLDIKTLQKQA